MRAPTVGLRNDLTAQRLSVRRKSRVAVCASQAVGSKRRFWAATAGEAPAATSFPVDRDFCGGLL